MVTIQDGIITVHGLLGTTVSAPSWAALIGPAAILFTFAVSAILARRSRR